jgi:RNA polymerase sigma-70 factor (ECF subfamily)
MAEEAALRSRETAEAVARRSYGKLVALLAARMRDVAGAEDALSDAFAASLTDWPRKGIPAHSEAWLLTVARRKMLDSVRRRRTAEEASADLRLLTELAVTDEPPIPDDRLGLMFACAHPAVDPAIRAPLILQTILGFDAATIASAFLISPATMGQRLVRAKTKIKQADIPFHVPEGNELADRLDAVLAAIYAAFSEGWSDPEGTETRRRNLAEDGIWLGQLVVSLMPNEPEALGLLSLMLHAEARRGARRTADGHYVPLAKQDPVDWNRELLDAAEALLFRAGVMGRIGRYQLEAAIQSAHVARRLTGRTDWAAIEQLYGALSAITGSPVVAINRAIATAEARSPAEGLAALNALDDDGRLADYQPYWAARAELLIRAREADSARKAYERAIGLEADPAVRDFLMKRLVAVGLPSHQSLDVVGPPATAG